MATLLKDFLEAPDYLERSPWFPNPLICFRDMAITGTRETIERLPWDGIGQWLNGTWYWMSRAHYDDPAVIILPILLAVFLTLLRLFITWTVFNVSVVVETTTDSSPIALVSPCSPSQSGSD